MRRFRAVVLGLLLAAPAGAQDRPRPQPPALSPAVARLLETDYLTDDERKDLRIFHGVAAEADLDTPARRARWALIRGAYDDASLMDEVAAAEDRADAMVVRGEFDVALALLGGEETARAARLRAEALEGLGRVDDAATAALAVVGPLKAGQFGTAPEIVEGVRAWRVLTRVRPQGEPAGGDFKRMMALLAAARDLDRLYWPAYIAEAELLYDKDNAGESQGAANQAIGLNPGSARLWALIGRIGVQGFNFDRAEDAARRLDALAGGGSPLAAAVLARARMRQSDPEGASELIEPMLARYPKMRPLLALRAAIAALRYDFEAADRALAEFERLSPGSADAVYEVGRTLSEARQYGPAKKYLLMAVERAPHRSEPICDLGLMALQSGEDGVEALTRAAALDPFDKRVGNSLTLARELAGYATLESDHFIVRYKAGPDGVLARDMIAPLEAMYRRVTGRENGGIDHEPAQKTVIDLMPDARWFGVRIAGVTRIHTMAASTGPTIAMEAPREGPGHSVGLYDWLRVVRHEFTHTVTLSRSKNRMPHWFTEAAAVYLEDAPRDYATCKLLESAMEAGALFDLSEINIAFVRPRTPQHRNLAYAQGHWMYEFMVERWGARAPLELLDRYAAGDRQEAAFRAVLGVGQEEFRAMFMPWARKQLASWGMGQREGEPTLGMILLEEAAESAEGRERLAQTASAAAVDAAWAAVAGGGPEEEWSPSVPAPSKAIVDKWLVRFPKHPDLLEAQVSYAVEMADGKATPENAPLLREYAAARPVDPLPHRLLAQMYLGLGAGETIDGQGVEGAIPHLEFMDVREQNSPAYAAELARRYMALGKLEEAQAKAERAATIGPFVAEYRELAATAALRRQDLERALRHITALTELEPTREIHRKRLEAIRGRMGR